MNESLSIAHLEFEAGRFAHAIQFAQYALAQDPDDADALTLLGMASLCFCEFDEGIDALERAALIQPLSRAVQIELAIAYGSVGRHNLSKELLMSVATSGKVSSAELLRIAAGLEAIDAPRLAMEACRQAGILNPEQPEVHYQMGYYAQQCGHPSEICESLIRHAISLDPRNVHFRIGLASLLIRLERKTDAIKVLTPVIPDRLDEVNCQCCLKRIANVFFDCDDVNRARLCASRLKTLTKQPFTAQQSNVA
jgi:tetratricopeptide (TPR) repeat protein